MMKVRLKRPKIKFFEIDKVRAERVLKQPVPLWLLVIVIINSSLIVTVAEYYLIKKQITEDLVKLSATTGSSEELVKILKQQVIPFKGYETGIIWRDLGKKLVEAGAIDKQKFEELFSVDPNIKDNLKYLDGDWDHYMVINENNSRFMVNTLWALGLANKSKVLDEGPMRGKGVKTENMASTAGWTLGAKDPMQIYSSANIIELSDEQQDLVKKIAENVYRPCCGNSVAFPDCNHGMAALGYIQLAVKSGFSEKQIYKDLLAFNSYWFPETYVEMAVYFEKQGTKWDKVDPQLALSNAYSSAQGARRIKESVRGVPAIQNKGGGCGA